MGYRVVNIPHWHWNKLKLRKTRIEYIRMSRYLALKDTRNLVDKTAGEGSFFLSEYHYDKERPRQPWAWHRPKESFVPGSSGPSNVLGLNKGGMV